MDPNRKELLYEGWYYDVTDWIKSHPGGSIIEFYTEKGEDATIPIQQFHKRSTKRVMAIMRNLRSRPALSPAKESLVEHEDLAKAERHQLLTQDFVHLYREFEAEGLFEPSPFHVLLRVSEVLFYAIVGTYLAGFPGKFASTIGFTLIGIFIGRSGWLMHEGGHNSLTGIPKIDHWLSTIFLGVGIGASSTWWNRNHNRHHAQPNRFGKDADLDTLPLYAFNKICVKDPKKKESKNFLIRNQANLFLLVSNVIGILFWKIYLHPKYTIYKRQWHVLFCMALHYVWVFSLNGGFWTYFILLWCVVNYYFGNFALSHTHLPVAEEEQSMHWVEFAFLTTMDIKPSPFVNWWMGYLNFQIEHHLFPSMPQFRHPLIADRVKAFAKKHGLPYHISGYFHACKLTYENMAQVSKDLMAS